MDGEIRELAQRYTDVPYAMFIGRHAGLPIAMEGALKLKEISYLHAEAFPAGEMKHGPIALIEEGSLVVAVGARRATCSRRWSATSRRSRPGAPPCWPSGPKARPPTSRSTPTTC